MFLSGGEYVIRIGNIGSSLWNLPEPFIAEKYFYVYCFWA